jgi:hypothetical protein
MSAIVPCSNSSCVVLTILEVRWQCSPVMYKELGQLVSIFFTEQKHWDTGVQNTYELLYVWI